MAEGPTPRVTIPAAFFPYIIDLIFANADYKALLALRTVCKDWEDKADSIFARHVNIRPTLTRARGMPMEFRMVSRDKPYFPLVPGPKMSEGSGSSLTAASQARYARILSKVRVIDIQSMPSSRDGNYTFRSGDPIGSGYVQFRGLNNVEIVRHIVAPTAETLWAAPVCSNRVSILATVRGPLSPLYITLGPLQPGVKKLIVAIYDGGKGLLETRFKTRSVMIWPASLREVVFTYHRSHRVNKDPQSRSFAPDMPDPDRPFVPTIFEPLIKYMAVSVPQIKFIFVNMENAVGRLFKVRDVPHKSLINSHVENYFVTMLKDIVGGGDPDSVDQLVRNSLNFCSKASYIAAIGIREYNLETRGN